MIKRAGIIESERTELLEESTGIDGTREEGVLNEVPLSIWEIISS